MVAVVSALVAGGAGFFGGVKYQQSKTPNFRGAGAGGQVRQRTEGQGLRPVSGKVISKDENSITVELTDGSSKIVLLSENTKINKTEEGSKDELANDVEITAFGQENSDGSVSAENIQIGGGFRMAF